MSTRWGLIRFAAVLFLFVGAVASADDEGYEFGLRGWGPRVGLASDPDQIVGGVHFNLGEFAKNVVFVPDVVLGLGDDTVALYGSAPVWYRFTNVKSHVTPYVGGALAVGVVHVDKSGSDDTDVEFGLQAGGGGEWKLKKGRRFSVELRLGFIDVWDAAVFAAWTF